jgi:hypothetical protein
MFAKERESFAKKNFFGVVREETIYLVGVDPAVPTVFVRYARLLLSQPEEEVDVFRSPLDAEPLNTMKPFDNTNVRQARFFTNLSTCRREKVFIFLTIHPAFRKLPVIAVPDKKETTGWTVDDNARSRYVPFDHRPFTAVETRG